MKRALATFLCLIMVFALLPATALAGTPDYTYDGKNYTYEAAFPDEGLNLEGAVSSKPVYYTAGGGRVLWDPDSTPKKLTFVDATINVTTTNPAVTLHNSSTVVIFSGTNSITSNADPGEATAIKCPNGVDPATFTAQEGSKTTLTAIGRTGSKVISAVGGTVTINGTGELVLQPRVTDETARAQGYAIHSDGDIKIKDATVYEPRTGSYYGTGGIKTNPDGGGITLDSPKIPAGGTLDVSSGLKRPSKVNNSGTLILGAGVAYSDIGDYAEGSGLVQLGTEGSTYICIDGSWNIYGGEIGNVTGTIELQTAVSVPTYYKADSGFVLWEPKLDGSTGFVTGGKLTLNNATINRTYGANVFKLPKGDVNIVLVGNNSISSSAPSAVAFQQNEAQTNITMTGAGTIDVTCTIIDARYKVILNGVTCSGTIKTNVGVAADLKNVTVPENKTLFLNVDTEKVTAENVTVNGTLQLNSGTTGEQISRLNLKGSGMVKVDSGINPDYYTLAGEKLTNSNALDFTQDPSAGRWKPDAALDTDGYTFTGDAASGCVLTLGNLAVQVSGVTDPAIKLPSAATVVLTEGTTALIDGDGGPAMEFTGTGTITGSGKLILNSKSAAAVSANGLTLSGLTVTSPAGAAFNAEKKSICVGSEPASAVKIQRVSSGGGSGYVYTPAPATVYNDPVQPNATVWLTGSELDSSDMLVTKRNPSGSAYKALTKLADSGDVIATYNIYLQSGKKSTGSAMNLTFKLGAKYAGQAFTLVHQKADGTYEYFYDTADANGDLSFGPLYELSPFMLVRGTLSKTTTSAVRIPATGDGATALIWGGAAVIGLFVAAAYIMRRKRA